MGKPRTKKQVETELASLRLMFEIAGENWDQARDIYNSIEREIMRREGEIARIEARRKR